MKDGLVNGEEWERRTLRMWKKKTGVWRDGCFGVSWESTKLNGQLWGERKRERRRGRYPRYRHICCTGVLYIGTCRWEVPAKTAHPSGIGTLKYLPNLEAELYSKRGSNLEQTFPSVTACPSHLGRVLS